MTTTLGRCVACATDTLKEAAVPSPRREARLIAAHVMAMSDAQVFAREGTPVSEEQLRSILNLVASRASGTPMAYLIGEREFWGLDFRVTEATLIPRVDTEALVELCLEEFVGEEPSRVLDIGTGTGCILIALLKSWKSASGTAVDIVDDALEVARFNATRNGMADRISFVRSDYFKHVSGFFDLVVSNPPYIPKRDIEDLQKEVREHEPRAALDGGADGLDAYRAIFNGVHKVGARYVALEIGKGQGDDIRMIAERAQWTQRQSKKDLAGIERALLFRKKSVGNAEGSG